jgi:BON domain
LERNFSPEHVLKQVTGIAIYGLIEGDQKPYMLAGRKSMNLPLFKRVIVRFAALVAAAVLCGTLAFAQDAAQSNGQRTDGQIEMDVVHALDASQALKNDLITAATIQGQVTLGGTVSSEDSKKLAESIVKGVPGVTGVKNNLKVGNPADDANAQMPQDAGDDSPVADNQQPLPPPNAAPAPDYGQGTQAGNGQTQQQPAYGQPQRPPYEQQPQQPPYEQPQQPPYGQQPQQVPYGQPQQPAYGQPAPPPPGYGQQPPPPPGYGQPGYGQNPYPPQYAPAPPAPAYRFANGPVTVPPGTVLQLRTTGAVESKRAKVGEPIDLTVIQDVVNSNGVLAIPRGAMVHGVVSDVKSSSGKLTGSDELALQLTSLDLGGQNYPLESDEFKIKGPGKGERSAGNIIGGTLLGAIIGGAAGGGSGAAIGAVAGGTVGTAASAATPGPHVWIPAEALVTFRLAEPVTVNPVNQEEAARLAQGLYPGGPNLYRRGYNAGSRYSYPYPSPYPAYYGPVYYRPYYYSGGYYYWR